MMKMPPAVKYLLLANVICYVLSLVMPHVQYGGYSESILNALFGLYYIGSSSFAPYQFVTYMFMHGGLSHLFFNMFALWMFGRVMEQVWGTRRFLLYYLVCGLGAGVVQEVGQLVGLIPPYAMTIGASGAVYGILLAFGMTFPNERLFIIPIPFPIKAKYFVMFYAVVEIIEGFGARDGVAHFAHLGGMLFGLLLILYWRKQIKRKPFNGRDFWSASGSYSYDNTSTTYDRRSGYDHGSGEGILDKVKKFFGIKKKPKMTIHYGTDHNADHAYNEQRQRDNAAIDRILEKIRKNGYGSLTAEEKEMLFDASKK